ncbi:hypothetical protein DFQ27_007837 [Actinomortierella ambigua]|uniref:Tubulin-specific chaperone A n=1 Tax=Actinomortierella ambigua TaxID=1343610 RepID=A0A9P6QGH9_9FUNG|nr:hypothetical protein DFQ27_007837 [Actinomortierella ambigua]
MSTRDLTIKTNVLKRLAKEKIFYEKEKVAQEAKIEAMIVADPDNYDIKKQREVLDETLDMFPDLERRTLAAREDLAKIVNTCPPDLRSSKEYEDAVQMLEAHE